MEVVNEVSVSRPEQIAAMLEPGPDGPIYMVLRLYGPSDDVLDGNWSPPPVRRVG